jgi:predicted Fe-Mo cluster-binding NifX family protein
MKIAVTSTGPGLDAPVDPRFGRAQYILVVDLESMAVEPIENPGVQASGGAGVQTVQMVAAMGAAAVLTGNVGPNAHSALSAAGLKVHVGAAGTVRQAVEAYLQNELQETTEPSVGSHSRMDQASRRQGR